MTNGITIKSCSRKGTQDYRQTQRLERCSLSSILSTHAVHQSLEVLSTPICGFLDSGVPKWAPGHSIDPISSSLELTKLQRYGLWGPAGHDCTVVLL